MQCNGGPKNYAGRCQLFPSQSLRRSLRIQAKFGMWIENLGFVKVQNIKERIQADSTFIDTRFVVKPPSLYVHMCLNLAWQFAIWQLNFC
jgi:hypothetical protein